jgi:flagellar protein FliJ
VNRLFRLAPVLRARKAQEDAARGAVIQSQQEIRDAQALVKRRQLDLAGADAPTEGTARAMVASMVARQSLAAGLSGAHRMVTDAEELVREKQATLADAAKRRRAVEMLSERHAETVKQHDLTVEQNNLDEIAVTTKARNAARGVDATQEERTNALRTGAGTAANRRSAVEREEAAREVVNELASHRPVIDLADARVAIEEARAGLSLVSKRPAEPAEDSDEGN